MVRYSTVHTLVETFCAMTAPQCPPRPALLCYAYVSLLTERHVLPPRSASCPSLHSIGYHSNTILFQIICFLASRVIPRSLSLAPSLIRIDR